VDQLGLTQERQSGEELLRKHPDQGCAEAAELVLLDQLVQVYAEQFKHQAQMLPVYKRVLQPQQVVVVVLIHRLIELNICQQVGESSRVSYEIQNGHLHHTLIEVRRPVLDDLDRDNLLGPEILALDHLSKRSLAQNVQNEVAVPARVRL
jgi:hypothetical protein